MTEGTGEELVTCGGPQKHLTHVSQRKLKEPCHPGDSPACHRGGDAPAQRSLSPLGVLGHVPGDVDNGVLRGQELVEVGDGGHQLFTQDPLVLPLLSLLIKNISDHFYVKNLQCGAGEMAGRVRAHVALAEEPGSIPGTHVMVHNHP